VHSASPAKVAAAAFCAWQQLKIFNYRAKSCPNMRNISHMSRRYSSEPRRLEIRILGKVGWLNILAVRGEGVSILY